MDQQHLIGLALVVAEQRLQIANLSTELRIVQAREDAANVRIAELEEAQKPTEAVSP